MTAPSTEYPEVFAAFRRMVENASDSEALFAYWIDRHLPALKGKSPRQLIEEGDEDKLIAVLDAVHEDVSW